MPINIRYRVYKTISELSQNGFLCVDFYLEHDDRICDIGTGLQFNLDEYEEGTAIMLCSDVIKCLEHLFEIKDYETYIDEDGTVEKRKRTSRLELLMNEISNFRGAVFDLYKDEEEYDEDLGSDLRDIIHTFLDRVDQLNEIQGNQNEG